MENETRLRRRRDAPCPPPLSLAGEDPFLVLSKPVGWVVHLLSLQVELISTPLIALLAESHAAPSRAAKGGAAAIHRLALGLLAAASACAALAAAMAVAMFLAVVLVRFWVEDPISLRRPLHFDYTQPHPDATVPLAVPPGHDVRVSFAILMPESDYNRRIGIFQVTTDVISSSGNIIAASSQPCMLRFRSLPIRLARTFFMGIPLLVGLSSESQKIVIEILRYKESKRRSEVIKVRLKSRSGTSDLPQLYEAELIVRTRLPLTKELVYNWKWTFYVWASLYIYITLLIAMACCFKRSRSHRVDQEPTESERHDSMRRGGEISDDFSSALRRWRGRRGGKTVAHIPHLSELDEGSTSSPAGGETREVIEDPGDFAVSESSECVGG